MNAASWRDLIKVHPAADLFPMMHDAELDELGRDIIKNGLGVGIVLWAAHPLSPRRSKKKKEPEELYLLDGRNRLAAIERVISDPEERAELFDAMLRGGGRGMEPRFAEPVLSTGSAGARCSALMICPCSALMDAPRKGGGPISTPTPTSSRPTSTAATSTPSRSATSSPHC
jgi:hypothetical protein